jgi:hypothetical protein
MMGQNDDGLSQKMNTTKQITFKQGNTEAQEKAAGSFLISCTTNKGTSILEALFEKLQ